jgi:DNA repair exonuclease SbcCD ATPase subunit
MKSQKEINSSVEQLFEQSNTKKIEEILKTHKKLLQIKEALNNIIDSMISNPSILSQAARYWNEVPLWQKISFGVLLVAPAFFIGIFVHVAVLTTLSLVALCAYAVSSYLLDDHFADHSANLDKLKQGIASLGTLLSSMVELLDLLNKQFAEQIQKFKDNNSLLSSQIESLDNQVDELNQQIEKFKATQQKLHQIQMELEKESKRLKMENQEQSKLIQASQVQLEEVTSEYQQNQIKLSTQIVDLTESKTKIEQELERLRKCIVIFQKTTEKLTSTLSMNQGAYGAQADKVGDLSRSVLH